LPEANHIPKLLETALKEHVFSGYQLYAERGSDVVAFCGGVTSYWPGARPIQPDTQFDIGSVTKVVSTASLMAIALERGILKWDEPIEAYLTDLQGTAFVGVKVRELLSHVSGFKEWHPLYREVGLSTLIAYLKQNAAALVIDRPRQKQRYSDINYLLLGLIIESRLGPLERAFIAEVQSKLQMRETGFGPLPAGSYVAATEYRAALGRPLSGEVFDENAAALGGRCGHAGLFSTARSLAPFCREWLLARKGESRWIGKEWALRFTSRANEVAGGSWGYGWDTKSPTHSTAGEHFSPASFGHLGYPGASIWIDPEVEGFVIFLSNRVHPSRVDERIRALRPALHDQIALRWRKG
jgi:CubicO group peptidase (beta-lactamase class C family)